MRLSNKTIIDREFLGTKSLPADFILPEIEATIRDKSYSVIIEKAYLCPCKGKDSPAHLNTCRNCGGSGWIFANPTKTKLIITGLAADNKLKEAALREWGLIDGGSVKITGLDNEKFTYMDRITILDATAEHNEIIFPELLDDDSANFAFTQYDILSINFLGLFQGEDVKLKRLVEVDDYLFQDNVISLVPSYNSLSNISVTVRYVHRPVFHVIDVLRESMTSTKGTFGNQQKLIMPIHALAKRAHLIKDVENFVGDRLLDNSWLSNFCDTAPLTVFQRQLKYTSAQDIYNDLTDQQKIDLSILLSSS